MAPFSLKYRIALTTLVLQAIVLGFMLWRVLSVSLESTQARLAASEAVTLDLRKDMGRRTLLTAEYDDFQPYIEVY